MTLEVTRHAPHFLRASEAEGRANTYGPLPLQAGGVSILPGEDLKAPAQGRDHESIRESDRQSTDWAKALLRVGVREEANQHRKTALAWLHRTMGKGQAEAQAWNSFRQEVDRTLKGEAVGIAELRNLLNRAPRVEGTALESLGEIFSATSSKKFAKSALDLARSYLRDQDHPLLTQELLKVAAEYSHTHTEAQKMLTIMTGGGTAMDQWEYRAPHLLKEFVSPLMLGSFMAMNLAARSATAAVLARSSRMTLKTLAVSELAGLAAEIPALTVSHRMGEQIFIGGEDLFEPGAALREMRGLLIPFFLLRGSGNVFNLSAPHLRRKLGLNGADGKLTTSGRLALATGRFGSDVAAVMAGNDLNSRWENVPEIFRDQHPLFTGLMVATHMRVASGAVEILSPARLTQALNVERSRLQRAGAEALLAQGRISNRHPLREELTLEIHRALAREEIHGLTLEGWLTKSKRGNNGLVSRAMARRGLPGLSETFARLPQTTGDKGDFFQFNFGLSPWGRRLALSGIPSQFGPKDYFPEPAKMANHSEEGGGSDSSEGIPRMTPTEPPPSDRGPEAPLTAMEHFQLWLGKYFRRTESQGAKRERELGKALVELQEILTRMNQNGKKPNGEENSGRLNRARQHLRQVRESSRDIWEIVQNLKILQRRTIPKPEDPASPVPPSSTPSAPPTSGPNPAEGSPTASEKPPVGLRAFLRDNPVRRLAATLWDSYQARRARSQSTQEDASQISSKPPPSGSEPPPRLAELRDEAAHRVETEENFRELTEDASRLQRWLEIINQRGWRERYRRAVEKLVARINARLPAKLQLRATEPDAVRETHLLVSGLVDRRQGSLLGLALRDEFMSSDSPVSARIHGGRGLELRKNNLELDPLHYSIMMASLFQGSPTQLREAIRRLGEEYRDWVGEESQSALELTGEAIRSLIQREGTPETLLKHLLTQAEGSPMKSHLRAIESLHRFGSPLENAFAQIGPQRGEKVQPHHYFNTGLLTFLYSRGGIDFPLGFTEPGFSTQCDFFHPSLPISLRGAYQGRRSLPAELFPKDFHPESFFERVEAELKSTEE